MYNDTTVAAIATPPGKGGVALIRLSGQEALDIAARCFVPRENRKMTDLPARHAVYGDILYGGNPIDDVLLTFFPAPHSYTGENTVEISCHGGILVTRRVLDALFEAGATPAPAGEFTRRALISGRLTLTEAEAIGKLLEAKSDAQIHMASATARGKLAGEIAMLHDDLLRLLGTLYAKIDYPEEDLADLTEEEILATLDGLLARADRLAATYRTGRAVSEGIPTVLCGSPNVGKSSLYNLLTGESLAIVTEYAGTTRDLLSADISLGRVLLRLTDTAGLRETEDPVEKIGVARTKESLAACELALAVFDGGRPLDAGDRELIKTLRDAPYTTVALINKGDLPRAIEEEELAAAFPHVLTVSAKTGAGREDLSALLDRLFTDGDITLGQDAVIATARQNAALLRAKEELGRGRDAFSAGYPADIASSDLELALGSLAELSGREVSDEIVSEIFSHFCVGK